jgi:imidazolonepropionase-like amidohydrolase
MSEELHGTRLIRNVRIFDGNRILSEDSVLVRDGKIARIGQGLDTGEAVDVVSGSNRTLLPGLIDSHTHTYPSALEQALVFGVTTELEMFGNPRLVASIKLEEATSGSPSRADLFSACIGATVPGGHPTELPFFSKVPTIAEPERAKDFVDARFAEGSDFLKIIYDDGQTHGLTYPTMSTETMSALISAAHERDKLAVVHIASFKAAQEAITAGVDGLAHLFVDHPSDPSFAQLVAHHNAFVIPTLTTLESAMGTPSGSSLVVDSDLAPYLSPYDRWNLATLGPANAAAGASFAAAKQALVQLHNADVPILAGTDAPNPGTAHGVSIHRELELLVEAGLEPIEALSAATSVPAKHFDLTDRGRIAVGQRADLLLVQGDPTNDILATRNIVAVWKAGVLVDRAAYLTAGARLRRWTFGWVQRLLVGFNYWRMRRGQSSLD